MPSAESMPQNAADSSQHVLDPPESIAEIMFGLIMVLTFTCSLSVESSGRGEVQHMLIGAFGCNVAWGIIDGIFYLMDSLSTRGHAIATLRKVREATDPKQAHQAITGALPPVLASVLAEGDLEVLRQKLNRLRIPARPVLTVRNWRGAFGVMLRVFLATLPPTLPFVFVSNVRVALRLSNAVAIAMLLGLGYAYGRYAHHRPWGWAFSMAVLGGAMVWLTIAVGG
jgi:VIT family protein